MALMKLMIVAYSDPHYTMPVSTDSIYTAQINPEQFSHSHSIAYNDAPSTDTAGTTTKYTTINPETVSFTFYLDGTGVVTDVTPANPAPVSAAVTRFKRVAYRYNGDIHSPNYLQLVWGDFLLKCRLTSLEVEYTLFNALGIPLRAKLTPHFEQFLDSCDLAKQSAKSSPDMTHVRTVVAGDTLPLMCQRIYGDSAHYLRVAHHNHLADFRHLRPGQRIAFPPISGNAA